MAKINVTSSEFGDIVAMFLFDKILHSDDVLIENTHFTELTNKMESKGFKPILLRYYIDANPNLRIKYKRIKDIFEGLDSGSTVINIKNTEDDKKVDKKEKFKKLKDIIKKVAQKIMLKEDLNIDDVVEEEFELFFSEEDE